MTAFRGEFIYSFIYSFIHSCIYSLPYGGQPHAYLVESVVLVLEAGAEMGVDLQGVVVGGQLERQGRVTLLLKTLVGIQHLKGKKEMHTVDVGTDERKVSRWQNRIKSSYFVIFLFLFLLMLQYL